MAYVTRIYVNTYLIFFRQNLLIFCLPDFFLYSMRYVNICFQLSLGLAEFIFIWHLLAAVCWREQKAEGYSVSRSLTYNLFQNVPLNFILVLLKTIKILTFVLYFDKQKFVFY
jgi:hypothetical protein